MVNVLQTQEFVARQLAALLAKYGFRLQSNVALANRRPSDVTWQIQVGCRQDVVSARILISLIAGLRFNDIERLRGRDEDNVDVPTIAVPIHFFHADRRLLEWDASDPNAIDLMVSEVEQYALPFFKHYEDRKNLQNALESANPRDWLSVAAHVRPELLAATTACLGKTKEAQLVLEKELAARQAKPIGHRLGLERMLEKLRGGAEKE